MRRPACATADGRGGSDFDAVMARLECSLAAGWWRPVSALAAVSRDCRFDVKHGEPVTKANESCLASCASLNERGGPMLRGSSNFDSIGPDFSPAMRAHERDRA